MSTTPFSATYLRLGARMMLLFLLASMRAVYWEVEQPGSSTFIYFPYLRFVAKILKHEIPVSLNRLSQP